MNKFEEDDYDDYYDYEYDEHGKIIGFKDKPPSSQSPPAAQQPPGHFTLLPTSQFTCDTCLYFLLLKLMLPGFNYKFNGLVMPLLQGSIVKMYSAYCEYQAAGQPVS